MPVMESIGCRVQTAAPPERPAGLGLGGRSRDAASNFGGRQPEKPRGRFYPPRFLTARPGHGRRFRAYRLGKPSRTQSPPIGETATTPAGLFAKTGSENKPTAGRLTARLKEHGILPGPEILRQLSSCSPSGMRATVPAGSAIGRSCHGRVPK